MTTTQLQLDLWQQLEFAHAEPIATDWRQLCLAFDQVIAQTPTSLQLATAANAIEQMAEVFEKRAIAWFENWQRKPSDGPILGEDIFAELVRQSFHLDLSDLVAEPERYERRVGLLTHSVTESVVEYRDKTEVLQESFVETQPTEAAAELEHDEDVSAWAETIALWMQQRGLERVGFVEVLDGTELTVVKGWLAILLGGFELRQCGGFYEGTGVVIWLGDRPRLSSSPTPKRSL